MSQDTRAVIKVVAYITRETERGRQLLVFRHARHIETPIQVPQGTVDDDEDVVDGLWRELFEETGRRDFQLVSHIAKAPSYADWRNERQERNVFHLAAPVDVPDTWSHVVTAGDSDTGLEFEYFWLPLSETGPLLDWSQNRWLDPF
jgi:ADP-ribose pyrophosphatase YjhB (NUDIX family)